MMMFALGTVKDRHLLHNYCPAGVTSLGGEPRAAPATHPATSPLSYRHPTPCPTPSPLSYTLSALLPSPYTLSYIRSLISFTFSLYSRLPSPYLLLPSPLLPFLPPLSYLLSYLLSLLSPTFLYCPHFLSLADQSSADLFLIVS